MNVIHEYVWFVLGGAAFIAFVLGLIIRGMLSAGKTRRATVERDVAITELEQVRGELDSLYAAQRKQREQAAASANITPEELQERDERLARMSSELEGAKSELQALRDARQEAPADTAPATDDEAGELKSRNAFLEERVGELEARLHDLAQQGTDAPAEDGDPEEKKDWQIGFLKSRVTALEEKLLEAGDGAQAPEEAEADKTADEELARLRWRNRYLEGRLAYFEEAPAEDPAGRPEALKSVPEPASGPEGGDGPEPADIAVADNDEGEHPSEGMLRALGSGEEDEPQEQDDSEGDAGVDGQAGDDANGGVPVVEGVAPPGQEKPNGQPDDLTLISGVGPRIQTILNDFGVWHFSQIADWSPQNEAWIDTQLNFAGRVSREGWVHQARELVAANEKAD